MWPTRRQLSGDVKNCWPASCVWLTGSQSRNSARTCPSGWRATLPTVSACAPIARQSAKARRGGDARVLLQEGGRLERAEEAGAGEVALDDAGDRAREVSVALEARHRDRQRIERALRDVELQRLGGRRRGRRDADGEGEGRAGAGDGGEQRHWQRHGTGALFVTVGGVDRAADVRQSICRGSKLKVMFCQDVYFSGGSA